MGPTVTIVALPLGNPEDLSPRAAKALARAHRIYCEDTRKLEALATRAGIELKAKLHALPSDRERETDWPHLFESAAAGEAWAWVSDAGTPIVNDPGLFFLRACREAGVTVTAIPGPSAPVLAWQWSGGFGLPFLFAGFAPKAKDPASKDLARFFELIHGAGTFAFFDTRHQIEVTLSHLEATGHGARKLFIAREMTKTYEELLSGTVSSCLADLKKRLASGEGIGELTLLCEGSPGVDHAVACSLDDLALVRSGGTKDAARIAAKLTGLPVGTCYKRFTEEA